MGAVGQAGAGIGIAGCAGLVSPTADDVPKAAQENSDQKTDRAFHIHNLLAPCWYRLC